MEKTWLAEKAAEKEKQKLEQLKKEKQQERNIEELQRLQDTSSSDRDKLYLYLFKILAF